ncbi:MAG: terminase small subunit [Oscillospiraceae bacterium]|jgi:hypothetical protein|nr:terminase small subunit [Oscillospiraceae bacterium]
MRRKPENSEKPVGEAVLDQLRRIAFADVTDYLEYRTVKDGEEPPRQEYILKDSRKVDGGPISEITVSKDGSLKFKLYDKMKALELLGRGAGVFTPEDPEPPKEDEPISPSEALEIIRKAAAELTINN